MTRLPPRTARHASHVQHIRERTHSRDMCQVVGRWPVSVGACGVRVFMDGWMDGRLTD